MVFTLASIALPGQWFVGEFLILLGTFKVSTLECVLAATAMFLHRPTCFFFIAASSSAP